MEAPLAANGPPRQARGTTVSRTPAATGGAVDRPRCEWHVRRSTGRSRPARPRPGPPSRRCAGRWAGRRGARARRGESRAAVPVGGAGMSGAVGWLAPESAGWRARALPARAHSASAGPAWFGASWCCAWAVVRRSPSPRRGSHSRLSRSHWPRLGPWTRPAPASAACRCVAGAAAAAARPRRLRGVRRALAHMMAHAGKARRSARRTSEKLTRRPPDLRKFRTGVETSRKVPRIRSTSRAGVGCPVPNAPGAPANAAPTLRSLTSKSIASRLPSHV
jgi:hypothetical protein